MKKVTNVYSRLDPMRGAKQTGFFRYTADRFRNLGLFPGTDWVALVLPAESLSSLRAKVKLRRHVV